MKRLRRWCVIGTGTLLTLAAAPPAFAGSPDDSVYGGVAGNIQGDVAGSQPAGNLPFTGLNLALILIGGVALVGIGVLLRRRAGTSH